MMNLGTSAISKYRKTSNVRRTLVGNTIVDHSDVVGAGSNYIFILDLSSGFKGFGKDSCKTVREFFSGEIWCILY